VQANSALKHRFVGIISALMCVQGKFVFLLKNVIMVLVSLYVEESFAQIISNVSATYVLTLVMVKFAPQLSNA
jgi:hypothetical protein